MDQDIQVTREIRLEADAESLDPMRKDTRGFTIIAMKGNASAATTQLRHDSKLAARLINTSNGAKRRGKPFASSNAFDLFSRS